MFSAALRTSCVAPVLLQDPIGRVNRTLPTEAGAGGTMGLVAGDGSSTDPVMQAPPLTSQAFAGHPKEVPGAPPRGLDSPPDASPAHETWQGLDRRSAKRGQQRNGRPPPQGGTRSLYDGEAKGISAFLLCQEQGQYKVDRLGVGRLGDKYIREGTVIFWLEAMSTTAENPRLGSCVPTPWMLAANYRVTSPGFRRGGTAG